MLMAQDTNATTTEALGAQTAAARRVMVDRQLRPYDVNDLEVLDRFLVVPREIFLPRHLASAAYSDLSIESEGGKRWEPAPLVLARFLQIADIRPHHKVLHVAGGEGYAAALLSGLAGEVVALESEPALVARARENLAKVGAGAVRLVTGPLAKGAPADAPFDPAKKMSEARTARPWKPRGPCTGGCRSRWWRASARGGATSRSRRPSPRRSRR